MLAQASLAPTVPLDQRQEQTLRRAIRIGQTLHLGLHLAAIVWQESSLGLFPDSPGHYGVGSCSWFVYHHVTVRHPWLQRYFHGKNWATVLVRNPTVALWVAGYWLTHCRRLSPNWPSAYGMYRYGHPTTVGAYPQRVIHRLQEVSYFVR